QPPTPPEHRFPGLM
uniref:Tachykinin-like peptide-I n=1 Tax=Polistes lanio TaxID=91419 RepID=TLP1_POLLN|nr:RecName: Full=Tachykinin-like peptide-I; Short=PllTkP-I [Polistes lanio]